MSFHENHSPYRMGPRPYQRMLAELAQAMRELCEPSWDGKQPSDEECARLVKSARELDRLSATFGKLENWVEERLFDHGGLGSTVDRWQRGKLARADVVRDMPSMVLDTVEACPVTEKEPPGASKGRSRLEELLRELVKELRDAHLGAESEVRIEVTPCEVRCGRRTRTIDPSTGLVKRCGVWSMAAYDGPEQVRGAAEELEAPIPKPSGAVRM